MPPETLWAAPAGTGAAHRNAPLARGLSSPEQEGRAMSILTGSRRSGGERPGADPDGRLAALIWAGSVGTVCGLVATAIVFRDWSGIGGLATAAMMVISAITGGALGVVAVAARRGSRAQR